MNRRELIKGAAWSAAGSALFSRQVEAMSPGHRIVLGTVSPYLLYDDFSRYANAAVMSGQVPLIGPAWGTSGANVPTIASGKLQSAGTGYLFDLLSQAPASISAEMDFTGGADLTKMGMTIAFSSDASFTLADLLHLNYGPIGFNLTVRQASGSFNSILADNWLTAMSNDGVTHKISLQAQSNNVVLIGPSGEQWNVTDSRVSSVLGGNVLWEPNKQTDGLQAEVSKAYATKAAPFTYVNYAALNSSDLSNLTLSQSNTKATSTSASTAQVRTVLPNANQQVYFEVRAVTMFNPSTARVVFGIANATHSLATLTGNDLNSCGFSFSGTTTFRLNSVATTVAAGGALQADQGDTVAIAIDFNLKKMWCRNVTKNTGWNNDVVANQDPANGIGGNSFSTLNAGPYLLIVEMDQLSDAVWLNTGNLPYRGTKPTGFSNWL